MASSISPLSYLSTNVYQSLPAVTTSGAVSSASSGVSPTAEVKALQQQGNFQNFFNNSLAVALLQPDSSTTSSGTDANSLVNNMVQQVLAAYQTTTAQSNSATGGAQLTG
jgi:regulatory protein YycI of two-component signal transduction system YycFG